MGNSVDRKIEYLKTKKYQENYKILLDNIVIICYIIDVR